MGNRKITLNDRTESVDNLRRRESFWQCELDIFQPNGLNERDVTLFWYVCWLYFYSVFNYSCLTHYIYCSILICAIILRLLIILLFTFIVIIINLVIIITINILLYLFISFKFIYSFIYLSIYSFIYLSIHSFIYLFIYLYVYLFGQKGVLFLGFLTLGCWEF